MSSSWLSAQPFTGGPNPRIWRIWQPCQRSPLVAVAALAPAAVAPGLVALGERRELAIAVGALALLIPLLTLGGLLRATLELVSRFSFWAALPAFRSTGVAVLALMTAGA